MNIVVLHTDACPHVNVLRSRLTEALAETGTEATVTETRVFTAEQAERWRFGGSPTILIDGHDPFPPPVTGALACRLYPTSTGPQGAPTVAELTTVLRRARGAPMPSSRPVLSTDVR